MESKDIQKLPELLLSLGYTKEEILKMMQTTPTLLRYTPETKKILDELAELNAKVDLNDAKTHHKTR